MTIAFSVFVQEFKVESVDPDGGPACQALPAFGHACLADGVGCEVRTTARKCQD